ncbi:MAG: hypothetical protein ACK40X_13785, partial [Armatimonadota bacterium]
MASKPSVSPNTCVFGESRAKEHLAQVLTPHVFETDGCSWLQRGFLANSQLLPNLVHFSLDIFIHHNVVGPR